MPKKTKPKKAANPEQDSLNLKPLRGALLFATEHGVITITLGADEVLEALRAVLSSTPGDFPVNAYTAAEARAARRIVDMGHVD